MMRKLTILMVFVFAVAFLGKAQHSESLLCSTSNISINDNDKAAKSTTAKSFEVTANPVNESVSVKFNVNASIESVKMIDNNSSIVFETGKSRGAAGSTLEIPVEDMEAGTYFVRVQTETGVQVQRIIISK